MLNMETTLAERMKIALEYAKIRKTDLYKCAGVSSGAVTQWFDGTTKSLKGENLFKVADALKVNPQWLTGESEDMVATTPPADTLPQTIDDLLEQLRASTETLSPAVKKAAADMIAGYLTSSPEEAAATRSAIGAVIKSAEKK